jgi:hypothetical protein
LNGRASHDPYEQNTQQSPGAGLSRAPQSLHLWAIRQASAGVVSILAAPQHGQAIVEARI